ncbi:hypothetical protein [Streptomyces boninensis]|uniref:hypothetical protein n=1 Tax=Streptomyces boninensis TaxID=2039455 RepID=UPI003B21BEB6
MSRENDNPSSGSNGHGGDAAYPPGTPPYPMDGAAAEGAGDDAPKTETTLTTRIRINIPGSRPIPPVVMRTPVDSAEGAPAPDGAEDTRAPLPQRSPGAAAVGASAAGRTGAGAAGAQTATGSAGDGGEEKTSDWFAPRKSSGQTSGGQTPSPATPPPADQSSGGASYPTGTPGAPGGSGGRPPGTGPLGDLPPGFPVPHAAEEPEDEQAPSDTPQHGTSSFGTVNPLTANPPGDTAPRPDQTSGHGFATGDPASANPVRPDGLPGLPTRGASQAPSAPAPPAGPTSGPATGSFPLAPPTPPAGPPGGTAPGSAPGAPAPGGMPGTPPPPPAASGMPPGPPPGGPAGPGDDSRIPPVPPIGGRPAPAGPPPPPGAVPSSNTITGGVPGAGSPQPASPFAQEASASQGFMPPPTPPAGPSAPVSTSPAAGSAPKGRSGAERKKMLVLAGGGVLGLLAVAYGAGLVLGQDDVPKGTTVLGVDIGGSTRDEAVNKLDDALDKRVNAPLQVNVGESRKAIKPQHAGLGVDTAETVRSASGSDYNPITVIGSLFGGSRDAEPKMTDDTEKLRSALEDLKDEAGGGSERGMIKFVAGKAVPVKGSSGQSLDVDKSMKVLQEAFEERAAGGPNSPVSLPTAKEAGAVTQAQFKTALDGFAKTAMSGLVTVKAGNASIQFSPEKSLPKFLTMVPDEKGNLQPHFNLKVLKQLYGTTFDGVQIERATGTTGVRPTDVAAALNQALRQTEPAKRVGVIQTSGG